MESAEPSDERSGRGSADRPARPASGVLDASPPRFDAAAAERIARERFGIEGAASDLGSERDQNFRVVDTEGAAFVLKISNAGEDPAVLDMENRAMEHVARTDPAIPVPRPMPAADGSITWVESPGGLRHLVRVVTFLDGDVLGAPAVSAHGLDAIGSTVARLGRALRGFFHPAAGRVLLWDVRHAASLRPMVPAIEEGPRRDLVLRVLDRFEDRVLPVFDRLRAQPIHGDVTLDNALFDAEQRISGVVDFGDMSHTALVCDLASTLASVMAFRTDPFEVAARTVAAYGDVTPLEPSEIALLPDILATRLAAGVTISAWRVRRYPENADYILGWDAESWPLLELLDRTEPGEVSDQLAGASDAFAGHGTARGIGTTDDLVRRRRRALGPALLPLTYDEPLHLVRGEGVWLIDADGRRFLDAYNNVPVVGHGHPRVVDAIAQQSRRLNTNTRYLFPSVIELAERLIATMPAAIDTCMFVNSGSEANDLAWRIATISTGRQGGIVTEFAYHGVTHAIAALSPEEWGAAGRPEHIATVPAPDGYRGRYRDDDEGWAERYAAHVDEAVAELEGRGMSAAAVYVDSGFTSDGILTPPPEYLHDVVRRTRTAGAVFVADEVQAGYGRLGSAMWSFAAHGIEPDAVTLGKPMGNGHPVAAVLTRSDLVDRVAETTSYFSTFGGNPVACAAALAVLDVLEEEGLQARARDVGEYMLSGLRGLAERHPLIGDVRGTGLLIGVELVRDRDTRDPASRDAEAVANGLRARGVLVGTTGPNGSALKVRPPLVFARQHADLLLGALDEVLATRG
jgi:4-aminobutyrate aminotransferase-like enzyme/Ser/Thr protein kinase RdoA (MazF antagonist)